MIKRHPSINENPYPETDTRSIWNLDVSLLIQYFELLCWSSHGHHEHFELNSRGYHGHQVRARMGNIECEHATLTNYPWCEVTWLTMEMTPSL